MKRPAVHGPFTAQSALAGDAGRPGDEAGGQAGDGGPQRLRDVTCGQGGAKEWPVAELEHLPDRT